MSLANIGNSPSNGITLDSIVKPNKLLFNYFGTGIPLHSGSLVTTNVSSGTFDLYRLVGRVSPGNSALYLVHIKNLTMPASATSGNISFGPQYVPLTAGGATFSTTSFNSFNGIANPVKLNVGLGTTFTLQTTGTAVNNYSFCVVFGGIS